MNPFAANSSINRFIFSQQCYQNLFKLLPEHTTEALNQACKMGGRWDCSQTSHLSLRTRLNPVLRSSRA